MQWLLAIWFLLGTLPVFAASDANDTPGYFLTSSMASKFIKVLPAKNLNNGMPFTFKGISFGLTLEDFKQLTCPINHEDSSDVTCKCKTISNNNYDIMQCQFLKKDSSPAKITLALLPCKTVLFNFLKDSGQYRLYQVEAHVKSADYHTYIQALTSKYGTPTYIDPNIDLKWLPVKTELAIWTNGVSSIYVWEKFKSLKDGAVTYQFMPLYAKLVALPEEAADDL